MESNCCCGFKMGREFHEHSDDVEIERYHQHPGCMGGIFNVLDYHHWYNVKKMFPHRKYNRDRRHARCCANPQTMSMEREPVEPQGSLDSEVEHIRVQEQQTRKTGSTNKSSIKASSKGLTGKEKPKEENDKHGVLGFSARPQLQQTESTHHMEPSGFGFGWMNPIILVQKRGDASDPSSTKKPEIHDRVNADNHFEHEENSEKLVISQKQFDGKKRTRTLIDQKPMSEKLNKQVSYKQVEGVDVLEIFKVNKDLFLDILQDPEVGISQHFPGKQASKTVKLTKSGSFPIPDSPRPGYLKSTTLEHKQKEVWSFRNGEKSVTGTRLSKSRTSSTNDSFRSIIKQEASSSSQGSDSQSWNHLVMNRLKDIKQRIKQALKERRKSINQTRADGLTLHVSSRDTLSNNAREMSESLEKTAMEDDSINNASDHDISNGRLKRIRRTKSISESLDRYTQLFQNSVSKEADLHHSKSLKLTDEDKVPSRGHAPKFFRRISSLSDLESFCSLLYEVSSDALSSEIPIRSILNYDAHKEIDAHDEPKSISVPEDMDKFELVEAVIEAELQEKMRERSNNCSSTGSLMDKNGEEIAKLCDFNEDIVELATEKTSHHQELRQPASDLSDITSTAKLPMSEGLGLNHPNFPESIDYKTMGISSRFRFFEPDTEADPCYNYVRDILELSGFMQNEWLQPWFSPDQPLNPSLFKELETLLHPELELSIQEVGSNCNHQLVFDLVNEALLEISEKTSTYFPQPFSFNCRISPMLKGNNVLQQVWTNVSKNMAAQPDHDQSLDDIVARDLVKDVWMNLEAESEFVALELEDLVFEELFMNFFVCETLV